MTFFADQIDPSFEPEPEAPIGEIVSDEDEPMPEPEKDVFKCSNCDFESDIPRIIKRHTNSIIECNLCSSIFCGKDAKRKNERHFKKQHEILPKNEFICPECNKSFKYKSLMKTHMKYSCWLKNEKQ